MILYKIKLHLGWKLKIITLKILYGNHIHLRWSDKISSSVKVRINNGGEVRIGENVEIRENCILNVSEGGKIIIEDRVFMNDGCYINSRELIRLCSDTMLGQGVKFYDHDHNYKSENIKSNFITGSILVGQRVWICSDSIVLRGCQIGSDSVIAAGTIIREDVSSHKLSYSKKELIQKQID